MHIEKRATPSRRLQLAAQDGRRFPVELSLSPDLVVEDIAGPATAEDQARPAFRQIARERLRRGRIAARRHDHGHAGLGAESNQVVER